MIKANWQFRDPAHRAWVARAVQNQRRGEQIWIIGKGVPAPLCAHRHPSKIDPRRVSVMLVADVSQKADCGLNILALSDHALIEIGERRVEAGIVHPMRANARLWGQDQDRLKPLARS